MGEFNIGFDSASLFSYHIQTSERRILNYVLRNISMTRKSGTFALTIDPTHYKCQKTPMAYELKPVSIPLLEGRKLSSLVALLENKATRALLAKKLLSDAGVLELRKWKVTHPPHFFPREVRARVNKYLLEEMDVEISKASRTCKIASLTHAYAKGEVSPTEVATRFLDSQSADKLRHSPVNAFIAISEMDLMTQAEASELRWKKGRPLSPLDGVPVAIKDEMDVIAYPTTLGTSTRSESSATEDATLVARLRDAGALIVGKANMHEIGINPTGYNKHHGAVRNPHNLSRDTGGSSSGSAASVAAGFTPISIGADGGGSIRIPAALCGVVGMKATFGRISEHGVPPLCWSVGHVGPLGADVESTELAYDMIAGEDSNDQLSINKPEVEKGHRYTINMSHLRVGIYKEWFNDCDTKVRKANERLLSFFHDAGASIVEIEIPYLNEMRVAHAITILSEMATAMEDNPDQISHLSHGARLALSLSHETSARDYVKAARIRAMTHEHFQELYKNVDVIVTPSTALCAKDTRERDTKIGWADLSYVTELMRYVVPGNFLGLPAISVPIGLNEDDMPIGMQLMGAHWQEKMLFALAREVEAHVGLFRSPIALK